MIFIYVGSYSFLLRHAFVMGVGDRVSVGIAGRRHGSSWMLLIYIMRSTHVSEYEKAYSHLIISEPSICIFQQNMHTYTHQNVRCFSLSRKLISLTSGERELIIYNIHVDRMPLLVHVFICFE